MREFIKEKLVEMYSNCGTDSYGQVAKHNLELTSLFGENTKKVKEFIKENPIITISTYGGSIGIYSAICEIKDEEIKKACKEALRKNENYIRNMSSW